ncbi:disease resistance protein RUN1-like [Rosa sericea]
MNKLKISYDSLQDSHDKDLFLHIACFFVGKDRDYIVGILNGCEFCTVVGIQNLIDRCLVTIDGDNKVQMHQMIRDMGRGIVLLESKDPGKRSRLCHPKDSFKVLAEKKGTKRIEGLVLDMRKHPAYTLSRESNAVLLETKGFVGMHNLRLLQLSHVLLTGCYEELPSGLRWLCWSHCTLDSIPSNFSLDYLVVLEMHYSSLRKVGTGRKYFPSLKVLDLSYSCRLSEITDFSLFPNLERLILKDCTSLVDVHQSIEKLERLVYLNLEGCKTIEKLPENISMLKSLETLIISGCSNLNHFPVKLRMLESLKVLQTNDIPISLLVTTIEARSCTRTSIDIFWASLPSRLVDLSLVDCNLSDNVFPRALANLSSLKRLNLSHNPMHSLPSCIRGLTRLDQLSFSNCKNLKSLVGLPRVGELMVNNCKLLEKISSQSLSYLPQSLGFCRNEGLVEIEPWYKLEPLGKVGEEMINLLGLTDLKSEERIRLHTIDEQKVDSGTMYPLQGLYEFGIFHTFLPGNQVPGHYGHKSNGTSISFILPQRPNGRIRGLNVFSVYENSDDVSQVIYAGVNLPNPIITRVSNKSKGLKWIFGPTYYGIPDNGKDMIWLSHWKLENQLEGNNKVTVSVFMEPWLRVKQCGVELVYEQKRKSTPNTSDPYSCVIGTDFSEEQEVMLGTYFLCPRPASMDNLDLCRSVWFNKLITDSDEETDKEEEQEGDQNNCCCRSCRILIMAFFLYFFLVAPLLSPGE